MLSQIVNATHIGVGDPAGKSDFVANALSVLSNPTQFRVKQLECNDVIQNGVVHLVDGTGSASSEDLNHSITIADDASGGQPSGFPAARLRQLTVFRNRR